MTSIDLLVVDLMQSLVLIWSLAGKLCVWLCSCIINLLFSFQCCTINSFELLFVIMKFTCFWLFLSSHFAVHFLFDVTSHHCNCLPGVTTSDMIYCLLSKMWKSRQVILCLKLTLKSADIILHALLKSSYLVLLMSLWILNGVEGVL